VAKGEVYPSEAEARADARTGVRVRRVTSHPSIHHHPFYYLPAWDDAMRHLVFVSHRSGRPQIFAELQASGQLVQLTDRDDLNEWSIHPSHDGAWVYFTAGVEAWRVSTTSLTEERLARFSTESIQEAGMVGAAMGTTTLSRDDRYWAVPVRFGEATRLHVIDTQTGEARVILERDSIGHPQFHPDHSELLRYAGPYYERIWLIRRDGSGNRLAYVRDVAKKEWIVHETWVPGSSEILTTKWPHGVIGIDTKTGAVRQVCRFNAWHPMVDRSGRFMVTDTRDPDIGLQVFDVRDGVGEPRALCASEASSAGAHWKVGHCPYDDGPVKVYAPQHTHPHPNFSPDGSRVVFTSDRTGVAQVYEARVPEGWLS
jgi:oligogalacturonide lyase